VFFDYLGQCFPQLPQIIGALLYFHWIAKYTCLNTFIAGRQFSAFLVLALGSGSAGNCTLCCVRFESLYLEASFWFMLVDYNCYFTWSSYQNLTNLSRITNYVEQNTTCKANICSSSQKIHCLLGNLKVHYTKAAHCIKQLYVTKCRSY
jgi:hypothetical protein